MQALRSIGLVATAVLAIACTVDSPRTGDNVDLSLGPPLEEQRESKYVTDRSIWGQLVFDRSGMGLATQDAVAIAHLIETYHRSWLARSEENIAPLLAEEYVRIRQGSTALGRDNAVDMIRNESRGERPEGYETSMQLTVRDVDLVVDGSFAYALYHVDIRGGARWEYADMATVLQVFARTGDDWQFIAHAETLGLGDENAPEIPDNVPNRVFPIRFDFVYPAEDLQRAIEFYAPLLGEPVSVTPTRASFLLADSFFELTTAPPDDRIVIKPGKANGYGVIHVTPLFDTTKLLQEVGTVELNIVHCDGGRCVVSEDPSGNIVVWREAIPVEPTGGARPSVTTGDWDSQWTGVKFVQEMLTAWIGNDIDGLQGLSADNVTWIDDTAGLFVRKPGFTRALEEQLRSIGAGPDGVNAELEVSALTHRTIGERRLVTFDMALSHRERPKLNTRFRVIQIWTEADDSQELVINFMARARGFRDAPISNMDYTAYPVSRLGVDGRYYKTLFGSEPYRDDNWFGFWSTSSVFGLVGDYGNENSYSPVRHRSNGYADLNMRSAEEVFEYLQRRGAEFALVEGINNQAGIDDQPGYRQILVVDSEGNLINFSQYLEY